MADAKVLLCAEDLEKGAVRDSKSTRRARLCLARRDQFSSKFGGRKVDQKFSRSTLDVGTHTPKSAIFLIWCAIKP